MTVTHITGISEFLNGVGIEVTGIAIKVIASAICEVDTTVCSLVQVPLGEVSLVNRPGPLDMRLEVFDGILENNNVPAIGSYFGLRYGSCQCGRSEQEARS